jgi:hypothetical protein
MRTTLVRSLLAVLLLTLLGSAALRPAAASPAVVETREPVTGFVDNPCTGEFIAIEGFAHYKTHFDTTGDRTHFSFEVNLQDVRGVALPSGATYVLISQVSQSFNVSAPFPAEQTVEISQHLVRQGEDGTLVLEDDLHFKFLFHVTVNANGTMTAEKDEQTVECR